MHACHVFLPPLSSSPSQSLPHTRTKCTWRDVFLPAESHVADRTVRLSGCRPRCQTVAVTVTGPVCTVVLFFVRRLEGLSVCCIACQLSRPVYRLQVYLACVSPPTATVVCSRPISTRAKLRHTPHLTPDVGPMQPPTRVLRRTACAVIMKTLMAAHFSICDGPLSLASQRSPTVKVH
jgi:hypothetical protein